MNVINVVKLLRLTITINNINEHILERDPIYVFNVKRPFHKSVNSKNIKEHILERETL
ncbi:hypothetical protein I79_023424 [Cricetulus griseus]|uniref:Uncharacterized protein n=1 Tax=Cricetulus griseus TaxID=10029 RepID=G3IHW8_CRIGR|nr:hypothetical protein I79_023424 [Cricetulus griseus]